MSKKILILASTYPRWRNDNTPDFVEKFAIQLAKNNTVFVLAPYDKNSKLKENYKGITVFRFPYAIPGTERLAYRGGMVNAFNRSIIAKLQLPFYLIIQLVWTIYITLFKGIDVLNPHWVVPQGFTAYIVKILLRKMVVITTHGGDVELLKLNKMHRVMKIVMMKVDCITFVSAHNQSFIQDLYYEIPKSKFAILPMGVNIPKFIAINKPSKVIKILFIGRLVKIKGLDLLLRAIADLKSKKYLIELVVAGDGPLLTSWKNLTYKLGLNDEVKFVGYINNEAKDSCFTNAQIVVIPSIRDQNGHEEGLPVVLLEALAFGKAVVVSRTGSMPEIINGTNGLIFQTGSYKSLSNCLEEIITKPKLQLDLMKNAYDTAQNFSWDNIALRFERLIITD